VDFQRPSRRKEISTPLAADVPINGGRKRISIYYNMLKFLFRGESNK